MTLITPQGREAFNLTLTRVVFEFFRNIWNRIQKCNLTLTRVVFESF